MLTRKKLEEEIAKTSDPIVQKQLRELNERR
jgi:hypothetical protein